jgi:hypothetical protein
MGSISTQNNGVEHFKRFSEALLLPFFEMGGNDSSAFSTDH